MLPSSCHFSSVSTAAVAVAAANRMGSSSGHRRFRKTAYGIMVARAYCVKVRFLGWSAHECQL